MKTTFTVLIVWILCSVAAVGALDYIFPDAPLSTKEVSLIVLVMLAVVVGSRSIWRLARRGKRESDE